MQLQGLLKTFLLTVGAFQCAEANGGWEARRIITNWNCKNQQGVDVEVYGTDPYTAEEFLLKRFGGDIGTSALAEETELAVPRQYLPIRLQFIVDNSGLNTNEYGTTRAPGTILTDFEQNLASVNNGLGVWCNSGESYLTHDVSVGGLTHNYGIKDATCRGGIQVWGASGRYYGQDFPNGSGNSYATYVPEYDYPVTVCKVDVTGQCMQLGRGNHAGGYQIWCIGSSWWNTIDTATNCFGGCDGGYGSRRRNNENIANTYSIIARKSAIEGILDRRCLARTDDSIARTLPCDVYDPNQEIYLIDHVPGGSLLFHQQSSLCLQAHATSQHVHWTVCNTNEPFQRFNIVPSADANAYGFQVIARPGACLIWADHSQVPQVWSCINHDPNNDEWELRV